MFVVIKSKKSFSILPTFFTTRNYFLTITQGTKNLYPTHNQKQKSGAMSFIDHIRNMNKKTTFSKQKGKCRRSYLCSPNANIKM